MKRVIIASQNLNERALVAAQLQSEIGCHVDTCATLQQVLGLLVLRAALVIIDWSNLEIAASEWSKIQMNLRGARLIVLASHVDEKQMIESGIDFKLVMFRPFTVGEVVKQARELLEGAVSNG